MSCHKYKVHHNMSDSVISSMLTKVESVHVKLARSLNTKCYGFPFCIKMRRFFPLLMVLLFETHCLKK